MTYWRSGRPALPLLTGPDQNEPNARNHFPLPKIEIARPRGYHEGAVSKCRFLQGDRR
jgi:hypothetical protein